MNKTRYIWIALCIGLIGFLFSCEKPIAAEDPDLLNKLYSESKDTIETESSKYILETELYRDFMPGALFPAKRPLSALVILINLDSITIPSTLNITKLYIIKDQLIWTSIPKDSNRNQIPDFRLYKVSTDGPEWETEKPVDVVIEITNNLNNDKFLLIAMQQDIIRLE